MSLLTGLLLVVAALAAVAVSLDLGTSTRGVVRARLRRSGGTADTKSAKRTTLTQEDDTLGVLRHFVRASGVQKLERDLQLAGLATTWRLSTIVLLKVLVPVLVFLPLIVWVLAGPSLVRIVLLVVMTSIGYMLPGIIVQGRARERQAKILYDLPDVLDQVTISIESGLGFEAALARVGQTNKGPLGGEIVRVVQDSRLGMSRRDAYRALADRTDVDDLRRFLKSIVQAEEFGVPISKVVRTQTDELRTKRRQRAEEKAAKVALKLLFPMLFFMFPVLFILILTPAIVNMGKAF
jgi:tight adherence protein C